MKNRSFIIILSSLLATLALVISPIHSARAQKSATDSDPIAKIRAEWATDMRTKQLEKIAMLYTEDAVFFQPDGTRLMGRAAIRDLCKTVMSTHTSDLTFHSIASDRSGNLAYDSGDYSETLTRLSDGTKDSAHGTYLMVFKRQSNGTWLIAQQVWTDGTPDSH